MTANVRLRMRPLVDDVPTMVLRGQFSADASNNLPGFVLEGALSCDKTAR